MSDGNGKSRSTPPAAATPDDGRAGRAAGDLRKLLSRGPYAGRTRHRFRPESAANGTNPVPVKVSQRLVVNLYTAKRMWAAIGVALQRHEQAFGPIQTDVNQCVVPQPPAKQ